MACEGKMQSSGLSEGSGYTATSIAPAKLCSLPEEIIVRIFENLEGRELIPCLFVCRFFHAVIRNASVLQYNIELAVAGIEDRGFLSKLTIAERLIELKTVQESWATLRFRKQQAKSVALSNLWELSGGFLARGISTNVTRGIELTELPSMTRGTPGHSWEHRDLGVTIRDFTIDPTQDLAVLILFPVSGVYGVHLRTMSTGQPHPLAADSVLSFVVEGAGVSQYLFVIQVMSEFLAVLFRTVEWGGLDKLFVWNWHTGKVVAVCAHDPSLLLLILLQELEASAGGNERMDSFSFLSPRHFVVTRFELVFSGTPVIEVYGFSAQNQSDPSARAPKLVRKLEFPAVSNEGHVLTIMTRSDPPPEGFALSPAVDVPFRTAFTSRVLAVSIEILRPQHNTISYVLFVHHSTLLEGLADRQPSDVIQVVPWEEWGPAKSRMLQTSYNESIWVCYMHGTRYVRLEPSTDQPISPGSPSRIRMLDFNPYTLHRNYREGNNEEGTLYHDEVYRASNATCLPALDVFQHDVVTTLPYREVWSNKYYNYDAVMIDEECLVGVSHSEEGANDVFEFLCL